MNRWLLLGLALGAVLAAAVVYSLTGDEPAPVGSPPKTPATPPRAALPPAAPTTREGPSPSAEGPADEGSTPRPDAPAWRTVEPAGPGNAPPPPLAESPFATEDSAEIDYAFQLIFGPDAGVAHARAAIDVFDRCLKAAPDNRRCYDGLVAAQQRLEPGWTPPPPPQPLAPPRAAPPPPPRTLRGDEPVRPPATAPRPKDFRSK